MESLKQTATATATATTNNANATPATDQNLNSTTPQMVATPNSDIPLDNILNLDSDVAINECMERLGTRLNMMETELRYAWRALDLLSQEYVKMWTRLEKLESLLYEQQTVITQLLEFYSNFERQSNHELGRGDDEDNIKSGELMNERRTMMMKGDDMTTGVTSELDALQEALKLAENSARETLMTDIIGSNTYLPGSSALSAEASEIIKELQLEDVLDLSNETFYKNLNKAYRDDFTTGYESNPLSMANSSQLGMIWEESEEGDENGTLNSKRDIITTELTKESKENDVFTALDYKDYRDNISCVKEDDDDDLAQLSRLNAIDQVALEKLHELDRLTDKLEKDSNHLKELENCLKDNTSHVISDIQISKAEKPEMISSSDKNFRPDDSDILNDQTQSLLNDINIENWNYCNEPAGLADMLLLANMASKQKPRTETMPLDSYHDTGGEMDNNLTGYSSNSGLSPRHHNKMTEIPSSSSYTSCSGGISSLMQNDVSSPKRASDLQNYTCYSGINFSPKRVINSDTYSYGTLTTGSPKRTVDLQNYPYGSSTSSPKHHDLQGLGYDLESSGLISASYSSVACVSPSIHSLSSGKLSTSPPLSIISVRTKQDGYKSNIMRSDLFQTSPSPTSPPPPAPEDKDVFVMAFKTVEESLVSCVDPYHSGGGTTSIMSLSLDQQQGRLTPRTPHLPKSPKTSPKRIIKSTSSNLAAAKSDSGLSSMSGGWSSLEKSPGSPKSNRVANASSCLFTDTGMLSGRVPCYSHSRSQSVTHLNLSPKHKSKFNYKQEYDPYSYSRTLSPVPPPPPSSSLIVGGNHLSAFTTVKASSRLDNTSLLITNDSSGTFVPSPAPNSDISSNSSKQSQRLHDYQNINEGNDYLLRSEKPSIYSVAGTTHREPQNFAYASGSSNYSINVSNLGYPDLIGSYPISDTLSSSSTSSQYLAGSERGTSRSQSIVTSVYPTPKTTPIQFLMNKTGSTKSEYGHNSDGYNKTSSTYRNSFPSAQITDALTYYPTNVRDISMPENVPTYTHSSAQWLSRSMDNENYFSSSYKKKDFDDKYTEHGEMYTKKSSMDPSAQYRGEESMPIRDYQWSRRDWNSELDIRNQNNEANEKYGNVQFYDTNGVIVSQSGYISIASNIREDSNGFEKLTKKSSKKSGSLKSAMNSVSNWLPELRFKRHRSNSLPAEEFRGESQIKMSPKTSLKGRLQKQLSNTLSKKKVSKIHLVSTVSGIIQKAKKKVHASHSLSDSEQSEMEWGSSGVRNGRFSALSCRSEDSVFPQQYAEQSDEPNFPLDSNEVVTSTPPVADESFENELEEENVPSSVSTLFPTVGEIKLNQKSTTGSSDESVTSEGARKYSQVNVSGPPREFAVSRALGKFRQRQSSTVLDDTSAQEDGNQSVKSENSKESIEKTFEEISEPALAPIEKYNQQTEETEEHTETPDVKENAETSNNNVILNIKSEQSRIPTAHIPSKIFEEDVQGSPSMQSVKGNQRHVMTRHQVSLEIPMGYRSSGECDDDNRSTHSWRSTSRVSSRRQSTEDSIDSEDEWYCYELRKLEELEKQNQVQKEIMEVEEVYQPDENVKEKMSFVLKELKLKAYKPENEMDKQVHIKGVMKMDANDFSQPETHVETFTYDDKPYYPDRKPSMERRASVDRKRLPETPSRRSSIDRYFPRELPQRPNELIQPKEMKPQDFEEEDEEKEHSSGDTSGPDSPHQSFDETDYEEPQLIEEESRRSSNGYQNKISGSLSREGSESVPPSEMSVSIQGEWNSEDTGTVREGSVSMHGSEWENDIREGDSASTITPSTQKIKLEIKEKEGRGEGGEQQQPQKEEGPPKDGGVGSKWKLLKALKDRKAEEKEAKAEGKGTGDETTTTVSKFY